MNIKRIGMVVIVMLTLSLGVSAVASAGGYHYCEQCPNLAWYYCGSATSYKTEYWHWFGLFNRCDATEYYRLTAANCSYCGWTTSNYGRHNHDEYHDSCGSGWLRYCNLDNL